MTERPHDSGPPAPRIQDAACRLALATPQGPGAIAIIQLFGDVLPILSALAGKYDWPVGHLRFLNIAGIDKGLVGRLSEESAELMPHGGRQVIRRLLARLAELEVLPAAEPPLPREQYPEAADDFEALALAAMARAASPLAVDLLLDQPRRWRETPENCNPDPDRTRRLNRLIDPPTVVLVGLPNVGKSTLSNALLGRSMSIATDAPGTTRDYTASLIDLAGLVVRWHDTPGLRQTSDPIEQKAIEMAQRLIGQADLLIAMTDLEQPWPALSRQPDLLLAGKSDLGIPPDADLAVSALLGQGLEELASTVRNLLIRTDDLAAPTPWLYDPRLASV